MSLHNNYSNCSPRRTFLQSAVAGSLLFPGIVQSLLADSDDPLARREPHFPAKAKRVIFLFMTGGVSHVDTFDPKPAPDVRSWTRDQSGSSRMKDRPGYQRIFLKKPQWEFSPHGVCGTEVSTLFPHLAECVDDIALIRSMHTSHSNHYNATLGMHTGSFAFARPSIGSWVSYGLGNRESQFAKFRGDRALQQKYGGTQVYASDFLPALLRHVGHSKFITDCQRRSADTCRKASLGTSRAASDE